LGLLLFRGGMVMINKIQLLKKSIFLCCIGFFIPTSGFSENIQPHRTTSVRISTTQLPFIDQEIGPDSNFSYGGASSQNFTVIKGYDYNQVVDEADTLITQYYDQSSLVTGGGNKDLDIKKLVNFFLNLNIPYAFIGAMGEGRDNCAANDSACMHIKQDPMYRLDTLDCFTLVQNFIAMLQSSNLNDFKSNLRKIAYGTYNPDPNHQKFISYLNRNNFTSTDFNRVNRHLLQDVTHTIINPSSVGTIAAVINHANWFAYQAHPETIADTVRVLPDREKYGNEIADYFSKGYGSDFKKMNIKLRYIKKAALTEKQEDGTYTPNESIINKIPTPSVVEFVRDPSKWLIGNKPIKNIIGSDILVSHVGILYKEKFKNGDLIYRKTTCSRDSNKDKICTVTPVTCNDGSGACEKTMMLVATSAFPNSFIYSYNQASNDYACTDPNKIPAGYTKITTCNRVYSIPLGDYLTSTQYGKQLYMTSPSIIGVNIEKILPQAGRQ
jgi:hypothetical protein